MLRSRSLLDIAVFPDSAIKHLHVLTVRALGAGSRAQMCVCPCTLYTWPEGKLCVKHLVRLHSRTDLSPGVRSGILHLWHPSFQCSDLGGLLWGHTTRDRGATSQEDFRQRVSDTEGMSQESAVVRLAVQPWLCKRKPQKATEKSIKGEPYCWDQVHDNCFLTAGNDRIIESTRKLKFLCKGWCHSLVKKTQERERF